MTAAERGAVLNGTISGPEDDFVVEVVSHATSNIRVCSATLVAKNLIVTAQHCISNFRDGSFGCTLEGDLTSGSMTGGLGTMVEPSKIDIYVGGAPDTTGDAAAHGARVFAPPTTVICKNDIAFIVLDRSLEGVPVSSISLGRSVQRGELVRLVGYGFDEANLFGTRHARDGVRVALVGENEYRPDGDATVPYTFITEGPVLCTGDSGGPAFSQEGALVGVFSRFQGQCTSRQARDVFTQVAPFAEYALDAFDAAGATPILEPGSGAAGSGGAGGATSGGAGGEGGEDPGGAAGEGTGGAAAGTSGGGSTAGSAGSAGDGASAGDSGAPAYRGLRQPGGCRCGVPGRASERGGALVASFGLLALVVARRRHRSARV